jgi:hypothetical protein
MQHALESSTPTQGSVLYGTVNGAIGIYLDWVAQALLKFKCQLKLNWPLNLLEMYIELIYT